MSDNYKPAGTYELVNFFVSTFESGSAANKIDLKSIVHTFTIEESITRGAVRGTAKVYDANGVFYSLPFRGQELLEITYKDFYDQELTEKYFVYAITDIRHPKTSDDSMLEYVLHFVSFGKFWSDRYRIRRVIAEGSGPSKTYLPISEQAQTLFDDYYASNGQGTDKELHVTETTGPQKPVIPALSPEDAMHFLSRRAYSGEDKMNMFRFYETREKYYFADIDDILFDNEGEERVKFIYASGVGDNTPEGEMRKMTNIISFEHQNYNTMDDMKNGAYYRKVYEIDVNNRIHYSHSYEHQDRYQDFTYPGLEEIKFPHTNTFINDHLNNWHLTYVVKDYPDSDAPNAVGLRPQTYYGDIYNNKGANIIHLGNSRMSVTVYGRNTLFAGDTVEIELPKFKVGPEKDEERSGVYFVESVTNTFFENSYTQVLTLIKGGIRGSETYSSGNQNGAPAATRGTGDSAATETTPTTPPQTEDVEGFFQGIGGNSVAPTTPTDGGTGPF